MLLYKHDVCYDIFMMRPSSKKWFASVQISCFWIFLETIYTANLNRKKIAENLLAFVHTCKSKDVKPVYFAEICERGKFPKDPKLTKKSFNAQRKKINKIMNNSGAVKFVTLWMRFPKDYANDKIHFSKPKGRRKFMYSVRRVLLSHRNAW